MKPPTTYQEVLLLNSTGFLNKELCLNNNDPDCKRSLSLIEQLEKACWDGLLADMLPGVILKSAGNCKSFVWEVFTTQQFIHVGMGPCPCTESKVASIVPCYFYQNLSLN